MNSRKLRKLKKRWKVRFKDEGGFNDIVRRLIRRGKDEELKSSKG